MCAWYISTKTETFFFFIAFLNTYKAQIRDPDSVTGHKLCASVSSSAQIHTNSYRSFCCNTSPVLIRLFLYLESGTY